jgi:branched-chain amino acid transport system permease protein
VSLPALARLPRLPAASRLGAVGIALWGLRVGVVSVVVIGTIGSLIKARYTAAQWFDLVMFGLTIGSIYAQIALGYTMVYGVLRMINFAHGEIVMSGAFAGYFVAAALDRSGLLAQNPLPAMAAVVAAAILTSTSLALLAERIAYRPFRRSGGLAPLISAFGVSFFLQQTFRGMFGTAVRSYPDPQWQRAAFHVFGYTIPHLDVLVVGLALLFMLALYLIVQRTRMGTAMRAVAEDAEAAALMGIDINKIVVFTFALGGAMAGIAASSTAWSTSRCISSWALRPASRPLAPRCWAASAASRGRCWAASFSAWSSRSGRRCSSTGSASRPPISCVT